MRRPAHPAVRAAHPPPQGRPHDLSCEPLETRDTPTTYTWTQTQPGNCEWTDKANWGGSGYPNAAGDVVNITSTLLGNEVINLDQPITVGSIIIDGSSTVGTFTIAGNDDGGTDGSLTFDVTSGSASLTTPAPAAGRASPRSCWPTT